MLKKWLLWVLLPLTLYLLFYVLLSSVGLEDFNSRFLGDSTDLYQNVWSLWWFSDWMQKGGNLFHTGMLYAPSGVSLYAHALSPLSGLIAYPWQYLLSWHQVYNLLILINVSLTGLAGFYLGWVYAKKWIPAFVSGFVITFSAIHWFYLSGQMEMAALQWLVFYVAVFYIFLRNSSFKTLLLSAFLLILILLNTPYHLMFALIFSVLLLVGRLLEVREVAGEKKRLLTWGGLWIVFAILCLLPIWLPIQQAVTSQAFVGLHTASHYSADVTSYFVGKEIRISNVLFELFENVYNLRTAGAASVTLYWTVIVLVLIGCRWLFRKQFWFRWWWLILTIFFILSLGPYLSVQSLIPTFIKIDLQIPMPYVLLEQAIPGIKLAGIPGRFGVGVIISVAVLASLSIREMLDRKKYYLLLALLIFMLLESVPVPKQFLDPSVPEYVVHLADQPDGAMVDMIHNPPQAMYYQLFHQKPLTDGYVSKIPAINFEQSNEIKNLMIQGEMDNLCTEYDVRYLLVPDEYDYLKPIYQSEGKYLYDLYEKDACVGV